MALTSEDVEQVESIIANALEKFSVGTIGREGVGADAALYNPADGTAGFVFGGTDACIDEDDGQPIVHPEIPILTAHPGDQYGAVGNEPVVAFPVQGSYVLTYYHIPSISPGAPPGERWILHPQPGTLAPGQTVVWNSGLKFTNDGPTEGDGLGGTVVGNEGALTQAQTKSGHQIALNDTTKTIATTTAGGMTGVYADLLQRITHTPVAGTFSEVDGLLQKLTHQAVPGTLATIDGVAQTITHQAVPGTLATIDGLLQKLTHQASPTTVQTIDAIAQQIKTQGASGVYTIVDGAGNTISHVVAASGIVALGALASSLSSGNGAINNDILTTFGNNVNTFGLNNLIQYANLLNSVGAITSGQLTAMLAALVESWIAKVTVPAGSSTVLVAP